MLRATLKGMLSRKARLTLSALAVVLGVMFVSGAFVLTDTLTRSFTGLFSTTYEGIEVQVTRPSDAISFTGPVPGNIPQDRIAAVEDVPGVADAFGGVHVNGAKVIDKFGKAVVGTGVGTGAPRFGAMWNENDESVQLRSGGSPPRADDEVVISANLAEVTGYEVGDAIEVITTVDPAKQSYEVVGIAGYANGRDTLAGETTVYFTEPVAQERMLGETGVYSHITVDVEDGADIAGVRDRIAAELGSDYEVKTGQQLAAENADATGEQVQFFTYLLLGFAAIALFVGVFIIINTFSITVAQRTRELALLRAIGAGRDQVIRSVLVEAVVIGLISSVVGLLVGIGTGALLGWGASNLLTGGNLALAGIGLPAIAVILALVVGVGVTAVAALLPALRAARIPPVAALRDSATPDKPLTPLTVSGAGVLVAGAVVLGLGLFGDLGGATLWAVLGGVLTCFVGVALLTPIISRPVVAVLGRALSWGAAGKLGRSNSARNPRRTAITAAALMVSVAIVTALSVIFASVKASTVEILDEQLRADLIVSSDPLTGGMAPMDPESVVAIRALPDVEHVMSQYFDLGSVNGQVTFLAAIDDYAAAVAMTDFTVTEGELEPASGELIVDDETATDMGLAVGDRVPIQFARAPETTMRVVGIYERTAIASGIVVSVADAQGGFSSPGPAQAYMSVRPGASVDAVLAQVRTAIADSPEVNVMTIDQYFATQAQLFDIILTFVQILLGLAMIIAVLGVINTLALSMIERTREVGLLRAVGMQRRQVISMVTVESVVICVFGALLGIAVGAGLGVATLQAFREDGLTTLAFPWPLALVYVIASVFVGLAAAVIPALMASRRNVLGAIAYE